MRKPKPPRELPPIPATMPSMLGPIPVTRVTDLRNEKHEDCLGVSRYAKRDMRLDTDMASVQAWQTYWHEWMHFVLWDAGISLKSDVAERLCDAAGTARTREMLDNI